MKLHKYFFLGLHLCLLTHVVPFPDLFKNITSRITKRQNFSSAWCTLGLNNSKQCTFTNLCYNHQVYFIFTLTENSVFSGLKSKDDLKSIYATSVLGHSALPLKITITPNKSFIEAKWYTEPVFLLHRFKPDNLMHVIHDDLLPLYTTYNNLCLGDVTFCTNHFHLFFSDINIKGPFIKLYGTFSKSPPFQLSQLNYSSTVCFSKLQVGLSVESIFYQYGFSKPKGGYDVPYRVGNLINNFRLFMLQNFNISPPKLSKPQLVFITRQSNRKILNENFVETAIQQSYKREFNVPIKTFKIDFAIHKLEYIISVVSESKYILGMHGAGMFISTFLPKNSIVLELFPYGINQANVSPLYTMSKITGIQFKYFSWNNINPFNSFPHPEYPPSFGGLGHLSESDQIVILNTTTSSTSYKCCDDALFLSRMYQDTLVDNSIFKQLKLMFSIKSKISDKFLLSDAFLKEWFYPSFVQNMSCFHSISGLFLSWLPPFNANISTDILYRVHIETLNKSLSFTTKHTMFEYAIPINSNVNVWIMCVINGTEGLDSYITC